MRNYWPFGIFLLAMVVVGLIILTLKIAISNPVELQGICQQSSQYIDENANDIAKMRTKLLNKYSFSFDETPDLDSFKQIFLKINDKESGQALSVAKVKFFLTRPNTLKEDKNLGDGEFVNGLWQSPAFHIEKAGRYQGEAFVEIGKDSICVTREYFIR